MNKPAIFAAIAVVIIGAIATLAASTTSVPSARSLGTQRMMAHTYGLPVQRIAEFSVVFAEPVPPTAVALAGASGEEAARRALLDRR